MVEAVRATRNFQNNLLIRKSEFAGKIQKVLYQGITQAYIERNRLKHQSFVYNAQFSPDSQYIVTASGDNTAKVWNLGIDFLLSQACQEIEDYLKYNPDVKEGDQDLCEGVEKVDF